MAFCYDDHSRELSVGYPFRVVADLEAALVEPVAELVDELLPSVGVGEQIGAVTPPVVLGRPLEVGHVLSWKLGEVRLEQADRVPAGAAVVANLGMRDVSHRANSVTRPWVPGPGAGSS